jgi:aspartate ammonia-lyase
MRVVGLDAGIVFACSCGSLELNPFLPLVADSLLEMLLILSNACRCLSEFCVEGLEANEARCREQLENATAVVTGLIGELGYDRATELARIAGESGRSVREIALELGWLDDSRFTALISPESVMRLGSPQQETGRDATPGSGRDTPG